MEDNARNIRRSVGKGPQTGEIGCVGCNFTEGPFFFSSWVLF